MSKHQSLVSGHISTSEHLSQQCLDFSENRLSLLQLKLLMSRHLSLVSEHFFDLRRYVYSHVRTVQEIVKLHELLLSERHVPIQKSSLVLVYSSAVLLGFHYKLSTSPPQSPIT
jgi:hypothetical protein